MNDLIAIRWQLVLGERVEADQISITDLPQITSDHPLWRTATNLLAHELSEALNRMQNAVQRSDAQV